VQRPASEWLLVVPRGQALDAALRLAHELAAFPRHCLRSDRLSAYEQWSLSYHEALRNELRRGPEVVESGKTVHGATSFPAAKATRAF
jgi:enoyl-CoA hydratase